MLCQDSSNSRHNKFSSHNNNNSNSNSLDSSNKCKCKCNKMAHNRMPQLWVRTKCSCLNSNRRLKERRTRPQLTPISRQMDRHLVAFLQIFSCRSFKSWSNKGSHNQRLRSTRMAKLINQLSSLSCSSQTLIRIQLLITRTRPENNQVTLQLRQRTHKVSHQQLLRKHPQDQISKGWKLPSTVPI